MNKEEKIKEYYKKYQKENQDKYTKYAREYYNKNKDKFKKYYQEVKKKNITKKYGIFTDSTKTNKSKRELEKLKWERRLKINEEKRLAFIDKLKLENEKEN